MNEEILMKRLGMDLYYNPASISNIVNIQQTLFNSDKKDIIVKLKSNYICPALFPLIFSLPYAGRLYNKNIKLTHKKINNALSKDLILYGVDAHFQVNSMAVSKNAVVPFCYAPVLNDDVAQNISNIIENIPVNLSSEYQAAISSQIMEVFNNSYEHGHNGIGSFFTSYYEEEEKSFKFTVYDLSVGFRKPIEEYLKSSNKDINLNLWTTSDYIEWAFTKGNTTKHSDYPRGIGYDVLSNFAIENNGEILLCTNDRVCHVRKTGKEYKPLSKSILGTFFSMKINLDRTHIYK